MKRVLYCDGDAEFMRTMMLYLIWYGLEVDVLADSAAAEDAIRNGGHDLLIVDLWCEPLDGLELCRRARAVSPNAKLPILLVAPESLPDKHFHFLKTNDISFMTKYRGPDKWQGKIRSLIGS
jgi:two-component system response regulator ResD